MVETPKLAPNACKNCFHGQERPTDKAINCRRYPATVIVMPMKDPKGQSMLGPAAIYPVMGPDEVCGEYKINIMLAH
jgi:hypothetical protein